MPLKPYIYIALFVFLIGMIFRVSSWFFRSVSPSILITLKSSRFGAFLKGFALVIFSRRIFTLVKAFVLDVLLQRRTFREDLYRWVMHMLIYYGFMLLLVMHGLGEIITAALFEDYYSPLNPFFFLRNLFGLMVIAGVVMAFCRRFVMKTPRIRTNVMDRYAIIIVALIILSGMFLEGLKIASNSDFTRMVNDFGVLKEKEDVDALASYWVKEFGLVSPDVRSPFEEDVLQRGAELHEASCMECHSSPKWAFTGYLGAKVMGRAALYMDRAGVTSLFYYIHVLACLAGLALLPFTKMFHLVSTPVSLLAASVMEKHRSLPANIATRQVMELDACVHCGTCSRYCSAMMGYEATGNPYVLPSEKMVLLKKFSWRKNLRKEEIRALQEGVYLCTNCDRCTVVCPSGINLRDLWVNAREAIFQKGLPEPLAVSPLSLVRGLNRKSFFSDDYSMPIERSKEALKGRFDTLNDPENVISLPVSQNNDYSGERVIDSSFACCFECRNCTTVCPVVGCYENPQESLGLLPHQIMRCLGMGLDEMAEGAPMLWECVTCYQCQEHCPQGVKVADILYELKNSAAERVKKNTGERM